MKDVKLIELPKILDERGNLSFFENEKHIPFTIERAYWIYDVPGAETRGGHAYRTLQEVIIALSGSFDVLLTNGKKKVRFSLNRSYVGLFLPPGVWRHMENFSTNSLALIVADQAFNANDYIRDFEKFKALKNSL